MAWWTARMCLTASMLLGVVVWICEGRSLGVVKAPRLLAQSEAEATSPADLSVLRALDYAPYRLNSGLAMTPPMGWNSWNYFGCAIDEQTIREATDALISTGLVELGYNYVNLDDCWAELKRDEKGDLQARKTTFPSGIKALADYIHNKKLKFGIYSDAGYYTCQKQPGSLGHEVEDANLFASWGVDYLKYDNCFNDGIKPEIRYPVMADALNQTGRPIFFSICEWGIDNPAEWAFKIGNSWRTSQDITDSWWSMATIADINNQWAHYAGPGGWNDPDMLEVGNGGMTLEEYRSHFSLWSLMKAPLLIGCDVRNVSKDYLDILSNVEVISVNQDSLGVQGIKVSQQGFFGCLEVWAGPLSQGRVTVLLWNRCVFVGSILVEWAKIGLEPHTIVTVRDLWKHEDLPQTVCQSFKVEVKAHSCEMYIFTPTSSEKEISKR